jgi:RNA polymerase primary sigma factor
LESPIRKGTNHKAEVDQRTIGDFIASDTPTPEEDAQRVGLQNEIRAVMEELAERERRVLILRYGLENGEPMSLSQTANAVGITLDQVRLVEARALNKLRCPQRNYRLKEYVAGQTQLNFPEKLVVENDVENHDQQQKLHQPELEKMWFF